MMLDYLSLSFMILIYFMTYPPKECISSGLTLENFLSSFIPKEMENFVKYHLYRINITLLTYSLLPLTIENEDTQEVLSYDKFYVVMAIFLFIAMCIYVKFLSLENWSNHPIVKNLKLYNADDWSNVANSIDTEFNTFDKFISTIGNTRFYLTNSWILKVDVLGLKIVQKNDIELKLATAKDHSLSHISDFGAQILEIIVDPKFNTNLPKFSIRLSSFQYNQLKEALNKPIILAENLIIKKSIADHFIEVFSAIIESNPHYNVPDNIILENCLGCMIRPSEVKLFKRCQTTPTPITTTLMSATNSNPTISSESADTETRRLNNNEGDIGNDQFSAHLFAPPIVNTNNLEEETFNGGNTTSGNLSSNSSCKMCYCRPMWCVSCLAKWFASRQDEKRPENWLSSTSPCPLCRSTFCILDVCLLD